MKKRLLTIMTVLLASAGSLLAQKSVYIPEEWRNRTDTLIYADSDPDNKYTWSKSRSRETDNFILLWDKGYGNTLPSDAPSQYRVDIDDLLKKAEEFYDLEINKLGFVDPENSNLKKYKAMILMNHTTEWACYGGGYDYMVPALWLSPNTCWPVGQAVAHEVGHSFHYMCYSEASNHGADRTVQTGFHGPIGKGSVTWEQTAQWQAMQTFPELMYDQSIFVFNKSHNYAFTHEWHRYQSYWFLYYICQKYNDVKSVANVWNNPETTAVDFNEAYMHLHGIDVEELFRQYFDYACRLVTWDLDVCEPYRNPYIGQFDYRCSKLKDGNYQVALASCPQSTGFNVIPLQTAPAGTTVTTTFTALTNRAALAESDPGEYLNGDTQWQKTDYRYYNANSRYGKRGFRLGYVVLTKSGERQYFAEDKIYCTGAKKTSEEVSFTVPDNVDKMWLVVSPAPSEYFQHKWDDSIEGDDMWPYMVSFEGTDIGTSATVYSSPTIDGREIADITFTYDISFPASATTYPGIEFGLGADAGAMLGTAFQLTQEEILSKMQSYLATGPYNGRIMFYPVNPDGSLAESGSTANGYGHWFDADGKVSSYGNGYVYSEYNANSQTFTVGQFPSKVSNGETYRIAQALKYRKTSKYIATAKFVFNITLDANTTECKLRSIEYSDPTGISGVAAEGVQGSQRIFGINGMEVSGKDTDCLASGIYIMNHKKVMVK